jgi:WS/DGAT/MGAT family acyltransferase
MQQLGGLDSFFLNIESNACPMHVGGVVILEPSAPGGPKPEEDGGFGRVLRHIESRLGLIPPLRRRLLTAPLGLDLPYWLEDPDFDLVHHVKHRALPSPGDDRRLAELVCELASTRLDRSLPLWEIHFVEGLKGGRVAAITKMHHAAIDGISGAEILGKLLDVHPQAKAPPPGPAWTPDAVPSQLDLSWRTVRSLVRRPGDAADVVRKTWPVLLSAGRDAWAQRRPAKSGVAPPFHGGSPIGLAGEAPRTRFNRQISARRSYAFGSLPLEQLKAVKNALATTLNDVILGVCAEALRRYLTEKGEMPEKPLIAGVPMSTRSEAQNGQGGNQVIFLRASLHTDEPDPVQRVQKISREMAVVKERTRALPATLMGDWAQLPAPALMAQAARLYENFGIQDYLSPTFNVVISNVPGPPVPLYFAGMRVLANHPVSIPFHGLGFNITLMSYRGQLDYGLTADRDAMPDIERFGELLHESLRTLCERTTVAPT